MSLQDSKLPSLKEKLQAKEEAKVTEKKEIKKEEKTVKGRRLNK
jgi:hypothetical protein